MQKLLLAGVAVLAISVGLTACGKGSKDASAPAGGATAAVSLDGSSTVYPISEALGEEFQAANGSRVTAGLSGTGGGFKKFCRGEIDIAAASRPITTEEMAACKAANIEFIELPVALDALAVIINPNNKFIDCLTVDELKILWAPEAQGKVNSWKQVRASFPDQPVKLFGAGTDSGTFDYFTTAINGKQGSSRGDYTATEDDNVTVTGVAGDNGALGYLGMAYVKENTGKIKTVPIRQANGACVSPTVETARNASYQPLSRPLFYYVNKQRAAEHPQVKAFIKFAFNPTQSEALVSEVGYVALPAEAYSLAEAKFEAGRTGSYFQGSSKIGVTVQELLADAKQ
jgi:phosphate transport system substrate-binding protein